MIRADANTEDPRGLAVVEYEKSRHEADFKFSKHSTFSFEAEQQIEVRVGL